MGAGRPGSPVSEKISCRGAARAPLRTLTHRSSPRFKTILALALASAAATELTPETWDDAVDGKTIFVKFLAPW